MTKKEKKLAEIRELHALGTGLSLSVAAEISAEMEKKEAPADWLQLVWYSDECGGRLVRFKTGNPHANSALRKMSQKTDREQVTEIPILPDNDDEIIECDISDLRIISKAKPNGRLAASLSRTRRRIYEIAACNEWEWFFTGTLDSEKCDRYDLSGTYKRISQFVRDYRKKQVGARITNLIVPEQHKDGAWHFHGLLNGITEAELHKFSLSEQLPLRIRATIEKGQDVYTWEEYAERFGYSTMTKVGSHLAVSKYVTKYITKELLSDKTDSKRKIYYASRGLKKPEVLAEGTTVCGSLPDYDFENDWVAITDVTDTDERDSILSRYFGFCPKKRTEMLDTFHEMC